VLWTSATRPPNRVTAHRHHDGTHTSISLGSSQRNQPLGRLNDRPGTFGSGTKANKIDYLLLSPSLFKRATGAVIFHKLVWGETHGMLFPRFDTITKPSHAAWITPSTSTLHVTR
jgi:hypothetical protein